MRLSNVLLVLSLGGIGASGALVGCGSDSTTGTPGTGGEATTSSSSTTGSGATDPCTPGASCPGAKSECLGLEDYTGKTQFTLRMADLTLTAPAPLAVGTVSNVVKGGVTLGLMECNLLGTGTFSWLLQFDTTTGKLTAGGAKPAADPTLGYSFVKEKIGAFDIAPLVTDAPIKEGKFAMAMGADVTVPIYLDVKATSVVLLPLHAAKLAGTISSDNNCIGKYNSKGLQPGDNCASTKDVPAFIGADGKSDSDGTLEGYITLEEADTVIISALNQSLCVVLSGDTVQFGDGGMPITKCKRDGASKIMFQGDLCSTAGGTCKDAVQLKANFSASSVKAN
jgi:hypothetical protein